VEAFLSEGLFRIAAEKGHTIKAHDLRKWTSDRHKTVDDRPFGGGPGMVMKVEPLYKAVSDLKGKQTLVILTGLRGERLSMPKVKSLVSHDHLIIISGHYEGIDERVRQHIADVELSIGEYVLSGGELPALVIADSVLRLVPGVLGNPSSLEEESFEQGLEVEYPQYTRPESFNGWKVPDVLLSGDHAEIKRWRMQKAKVSC
jgi:tRNA (guanine37-N1)-methyltransferase